MANYVSAFICANFLSLDFLAAYPAVKLLLHFFYQQIFQFLQGQLMVSSWAFDNFGLFLNMIDIGWSILQCPESSFGKTLFLRVQFIYTNRFDLDSGCLFFPFIIFGVGKFRSSDNSLESFIFLEFFNFLDFLFENLLHFVLFLLHLEHLNFSLILSYFFLLLNQKLNHTSSTKDMTL